MIFLNGIEIVPTIFPDHTSQVWHLPAILLNLDFYHIHWEFKNEGELMHIAQLKMLLSQYSKNIQLIVPYLPYARQDKPVGNDETFALHTFAKILNSLEFNRIICFDAHSEVAKNLIDHLEIEYQATDEAFKGCDIICYPDAGALAKYPIIYFKDYIHGLKKRDAATGRITGYELVGDPKGKNVLIVDDICDGGMTFILLCQALKEKGALDVNLFVTHGIFSKGVQVLKDSGINKVFTHRGEAK